MRILVAAFLLLGLSTAAAIARGAGAAEAAPGTLIAQAKWRMRGDRVAIVVPLADALTGKQKDMIDGGFTTVSQLTFRLPAASGKDKDDDEQPPFFGVRCSVKFDFWEGTYDLARLDDKPRTALVKTFGEYGDLCLMAELDRQDLVARLAPNGGTIIARLSVKQTSAEEGEKIKEWLIQQQSGVMQGLFSHMLGDLSLNQTLRVKVSVPPKPSVVERASNPKTGDLNEPKRHG